MALFDILKTISQKLPPACSVVIAAAGNSQRCKGEDKLFYNINDKPVLAYTIEVFQNCKLIDEIIIVTKTENLEPVADICQKYKFNKVSKVLVGGETRTQSVFNGIFAVSDKSKLIAVHDGARACIDNDIIEKTIEAAVKYNAAAPSVEVTATIKRVQGDVIQETIDRENLVEIQTPQVFREEIIKAALTKVIKKSIHVTDESTAVEMLGLPVHITQGSSKNIKITTLDDLQIAEGILR